MRKMKALGFLGVLSLDIVLVAVGFHLVFGDDLLLHSDLWSLTVYLGTISVLATVVVLPLVMATRWLPARLRAALYWATMLFFTLSVVWIFLRMLVGFVVEADLASWLSVACMAVSALLVLLCVVPSRLVDRLTKLGAVAFVFLFVGVPIMIVWSHLSFSTSENEDTDAKHLVLIVIDGFPAEHMRSYNPQAPVTALDGMPHGVRMFREFRASYPYTHQYFGALYTGRLSPESRLKAPLVKGGNLLACLQGRGVRSRWASYHRNAFPEGCAAHFSNYRGLRSYFLTENFTWVPRSLGLEYHVAINNSRDRLDVYPRVRLQRWVNRHLNGGGYTQCDNVFVECLLPEMRRLRQPGKSTFLLYHIPWEFAGYDRTTRRDKLPSAQWAKGQVGQVRHAAQVRENDFRYEPSLEPMAAELRQEAAGLVAKASAHLSELIATLQRDHHLKDTTVIVTADHGTMFSKGRFWYGYHPNQEVVKVLCAVFGPKQTPGTDDRYFCTPDLTASIADYFDVPRSTTDPAVSIFQDGRARSKTASLTIKTDKHREWWLVIVRQGIKYWFNLHPRGNGEARAYRVGSFDQVETAAGDAGQALPAPEMVPIVQQALRTFGISPEEVHSAYGGSAEPR